tara:strand:+ start:597 stop:3485 length:2889 start_codon:yes stop_codon:yes gene_type:complete
MGIAYDVKVEFLPNYADMDFLFELSRNGTYPGPNMGQWLQEAWVGILEFDPSAPGTKVTDYIIRGETYINDYYIIYGSYRSYFENLYGFGSGGIAWDGFVLIMPAYYLKTRGSSADEDDGYPVAVTENSSLVVPMRLPYQNAPAAADAASVNNDSAPGVYACTAALGLKAYAAKTIPNQAGSVAEDSNTSPVVQIAVGGTQLTYTGNGSPTGCSYTAFGNIFTFQAPSYEQNPDFLMVGDYTPENYSLGPAYYQEAFGWNVSGNYANAGVGVPALIDFVPRICYDLEEYCTQWVDPASVPAGDMTNAALWNSGSASGYLLEKIYDMSWVGEIVLSFGFGGNSSGTGLLCGQAARLDGAGGIQYRCPFYANWMPYGAAAGNGGLGGTPSMVYVTYPASGGLSSGIPQRISANIKCAIDTNILQVGLTGGATYNLQNAFANCIGFGLQKGGAEAKLNSSLVGISNIPMTIGGVAQKRAGLYAVNVTDSVYGNGFENATTGRQYALAPVGLPNDGFFTAETGLALPVEDSYWRGVIFQNKTFPLEEEELSKNTAVFRNQQRLQELGETIPYILDQDLYEEILQDPTIPVEQARENALCGLGFQDTGNIYKPGLNDNRPSIATPGTSGLGYGILATQPTAAGSEPYVLMYDGFGGITVFPDPFTNPLEVDVFASGIQEGANMNDFIAPINSTSRKVCWASWDNDRDQWIFLFSDTVNGFAVLSVNSAFSQTSPDQLAYQDQTDNYKRAIPAEYTTISMPQAGIHTARQMTPVLDGLTILGRTDDSFGTLADGQVNGGKVALTPYTMTTGGLTFKSFPLFTIFGTTGRTARVWVDYLLFDGADSLIAVELQKIGLRVTVENVEWYKAKILRKSELGLTVEEIEDWVRMQQDEYRATLKQKERSGRMRRRRRQVAAWREGLEDTLEGDFMEKGGFDTLKEFDEAVLDYVPDPSETTDSSKNTKLDSDK